MRMNRVETALMNNPVRGRHRDVLFGDFVIGVAERRS